MGMDVGHHGSGKKGRARPEMNVTPLVDVVLVLLIIFMVVTPLLAKQFWINLPEQKDEEQPPPPSDDGPLIVSVTSEGHIRINSEEVSDEELSSKLRHVLAARRTRTVFFDASNAADFGRAMEVLDLARGGGATTIAVATEAMPGID